MSKKELLLMATILLAFSAPIPSIAAGDSPAKAELASTKSDECELKCLDPTTACAESERVLDTLKLLVRAYIKGDIATYEQYLADGCSTFDESSKKLITGKEAVLADLKNKFSTRAESPLISFTIDHPYARVTGSTAVVSFRAVKEVGGKHPNKVEASITDIFVKDGDKWKKLHYRGRWHKMSS